MERCGDMRDGHHMLTKSHGSEVYSSPWFLIDRVKYKCKSEKIIFKREVYWLNTGDLKLVLHSGTYLPHVLSAVCLC